MDREVGRLQTVVVAFEDMTDEERKRALAYIFDRYGSAVWPPKVITGALNDPIEMTAGLKATHADK